MELLADNPGKKLLLLGNQAIVRGAIEAGMAYASSYPGTPSSEVPDTFFEIGDRAGFTFEYAVNEKVAMEAVSGAAVTGIRAMTTLKHVGLNVAADPLMTIAYIGVKGGMVIYNADDPAMFSSQNEQDNRYYAKLSGLPMLEPTNLQEMKDITRYAFELSEELNLPVFLRSTTRLAHGRGMVELGEMEPVKKKAEFKKDPFSLVAIPAVSRRLHKEFLGKQARAMALAEVSPLNHIEGDGPFGIVTGGVSYGYVKDALRHLGLTGKVSVLKLGWVNPLPEQLILSFLEGKEKVLVVEELEPYFEEAIQALAQKHGLTVPIKGKGEDLFTRLYEYDPLLVAEVAARYFGVEYNAPAKVDMTDLPELANRPPSLCAGCPHRMTYYAVQKAVGDKPIFANDIGCYALGVMPPHSKADFQICMGSSASSAGGLFHAQDEKVISFIGDSTFFHSGITGLINSIHNNHDMTLVIMDNRTTAMTGHQPNPGIDTAQAGMAKKQVDIEALVRSLGVEKVFVVKPRNLKKTIQAIKEAVEFEGVSVVISKEVCPLYARRFNKTKKPVFTVDLDKCKDHGECLEAFACSAFTRKNGRAHIDPNLCIGCAVCAQVCPESAIVPLKK